MSHTERNVFVKAAVALAVVVLLLVGFAGGAAADSVATDFETFTIGNINGQGGWSKTGSFDSAVVDQASLGLSYAGFGSRSLRISNAVTSGSFGDQTFSKSLTDEAGETSALNGGMSGGTRQKHFEAYWEFASAVPGAEQPGLSVVVSPDRGDGARMSWIQMADKPAGLEVNFYGYDTTNGGTCSDLVNFELVNLASGLDRTVAHSILVTMSFIDGVNNDIVRVYVDGVLKHTGNSWEDYFRNCEPPESRTVDSLLYRVSGTSAPLTSGYGFLIDNVKQTSSAIPCTTVCYVDDSGSDSNGGTSTTDAFKTIQKAIDTVQAGGEVRVLPGTYDETASNRFVLGTNGPYVFGLFIDKKLTLQGVTAADAEITDPTAVAAIINTNSTANFGPVGIFVEGDDVTIAGVEIGTNSAGQNKTLEIIGDNFKLLNSKVSDPMGSVYFNDWQVNDNGTPANFADDVSHVQAYEVDNNIMASGVSVDLASGAGFTGSVTGRKITDNTFELSPGEYWPVISFNGSGTGVEWFIYGVGGAEIKGNTFKSTGNGAEQWIRARGDYDNGQFAWASFWNDNTYDKAVVFGSNPPATLGTYSYTSGSYTFNNVRRIGAVIQPEIDHAVAGDTVLVNEGTYPESPTVDKSLTLVSDDGRDLTTIALQPGTNYTHSLLITGADVTVDGFTVQGIDGACPTMASTNIYLNTAPDNVVIKNNRIQVGEVDGGCSTGDDGFGLITEYSGSNDVASLTVDGNIFEPLNAAGQRAFYINPSVDEFTFSNNEITGQFNGTALTQAMNNLVEDNTLTGTGASGGFGVWGEPDPTVWGHGRFQRNTISGTANAISIFEAQEVTVTKNILNANGRAVRVLDVTPLAFDKSTIHINRNAVTNNTTEGVTNLLAAAGDIDATCNWWGAADGPGPVGPGSGDGVSANVDFSDWLLSSNLDGTCGALPPAIVFAAASPGKADNDVEPDVTYKAGDVLKWDGTQWSLWWKGTDHGISPSADIIALDVKDDGANQFHLAWRQMQARVPGLGRIYPQDIVYYDGTAFQRFFEGKDVGLSIPGERINGLEVLPGSVSPIGTGCINYLLISTMAGGTVNNPSEPSIRFTGEDVLGFCMTSPAPNTAGVWHLALEGESKGLPRNGTLGFAASEDALTTYYTTKPVFPAGKNNILPLPMPAGPLGSSVFNFSANGLTKLVDSIDYMP